MKKVIIAGAFDCLAQKDIHLIKEALKLSVGGELYAIISDDYQFFLENKRFPTQEIRLREENLSYFIKREKIIRMPIFFKGLLGGSVPRMDGDKFIFVHYAHDKDFPGRDDLKEANITIKFIKPYGKA